MKHLLEKYCAGNEELLKILISHGKSVADKAKEIALRHPEWNIDLKFLEEAALLHDIGVVRCNAPGIFVMVLNHISVMAFWVRKSCVQRV